jgi:hypothetical protein
MDASMPSEGTCSGPPGDFESFEPQDAWRQLGGFHQGALEFVADGRVYVRNPYSSGSGSGPETLVTTDGESLRPSSETAVGETVGVEDRVEYTETQGHRYLLVGRALFEAARGSGNFTKIQPGPSGTDIVHDVAATSGRVVARVGNELYASGGSAGWRDVTPDLGLGIPPELAAHGGRIFSKGPNLGPQLLRLSDSGDSWVRITKYSVTGPDDWRTANGKIYAIGSVFDRQQVTGEVDIATSEAAGSWNVQALSTNYPVRPASMATAGGEVFAAGRGRLMRLDVASGRAEVVTDRVIDWEPTSLVGVDDTLFVGAPRSDDSTGSVLKLDVDASDPRWKPVPVSPGNANRIVAIGDEVWARNGPWFRFDDASNRWRAGWRPERGHALGRMFKLQSRLWGQTEWGCLHRLSDDGWSFAFQPRPLQPKTDGCVAVDAYEPRARSAVEVSGGVLFGFDGVDTTEPPADRALLRWTTSEELGEWLEPDSSRLTGTAEAIHMAELRGDVWMYDQYETVRDGTVDSTDPQLHRYRNGALASFDPNLVDEQSGEARLIQTGRELKGIRGGLYAAFALQDAPSSEPAVRFARWSCDEQRFELLPKGPAEWGHRRVLTSRGPMVASGHKIYRYRPASQEWKTLVETLPISGDDARVGRMTTANGQLYVSMLGGGIYVKRTE